MMPLWRSLLVVPAVVGGGAGVLLGVLVASGNPLALAATSALGCYGVCAGAVVFVWAVVTVLLGCDDRPPSLLAFVIFVFVVPGLLAWGLYHLLHEVIGSRGSIRASEGVGCLLAFLLALQFVGWLLEWRQRRGEEV
jgi:hypothetical protein